MSEIARKAGVTIPLSAIRTVRDWGVGEISDLPVFAEWVKSAGHTLVQLLPPYELAHGETSPYGARTAFGLDPIYLNLEEIPDLDERAIDDVLGAEGIAERARLRGLPGVDFAGVRALKGRVLGRAFERFYEREWLRSTPRAEALRSFVARERWSPDLAMYVALRDRHNHWSWQTWPEGQRNREPSAMAKAGEDLASPILEHEYAQWLAHGQWKRAKEAVNGQGVELMGDMPFIVGTESADVWSRAHQFRRDVSLGAPPDAFSEDGQDWGLPAYDWAEMDRDDLAWIRARTRHAASLYDRFRLDHVVGYFRMFVRPPSDGEGPKPKGWFDPAGEAAQNARGERVLRVIQTEASPARVIGEDLGVIPPFVRETLTAMGIPGYRVLPWENDDGRFRDPGGYPPRSVATWSTHDTAPITSWWDELPAGDRAELSRIAGIDAAVASDEHARWLPLLRTLLASASELTLVLPQEILGERTRINTPGTVDGTNWTYRLPRPLEDLAADPAVVARMHRLRDVVRETGRSQ